MKRRIPEIFFVLALCILGIVYRLWFITLAPQPTIYDQNEYESYAAKIFYHPQMLASHSYRSYPFPLALAILYKFVGFGNHYAWYVTQAVLDSLIGVVVYILLAHGLKTKNGGTVGYLLYIFNPFTAGYVGVLLSLEILATVFIAGTIFAGFLFMKKQTILRGLLFGFCAGMAAETRNAAFMWAAIPIALTFFWVPWKKHIPAYIAIMAGLILTVLYPFYTNWRDFHELSITKVDSFYAMEFFNGASLKVLPPFTYTYPRDQQIMWYEYWSEYYPGRTTAERKAIASKYFQKGWDIVKADPVDYIRWRFFKMWYVWQKENFFFYFDPFYAQYKEAIFLGNLTLLVLAICGLFTTPMLIRSQALQKKERDLGYFIWWSFVGTIAYGTIAFAFSHAEYRLTIPFYPVILSLAALGLVFLGRGLYIGYSHVARRRRHL